MKRARLPRVHFLLRGARFATSRDPTKALCASSELDDALRGNLRVPEGVWGQCGVGHQ
jgi:hypothetical protein